MKKKINLLNDPVKTILTRMTIPMMGGLLAMMGFNLVDTFFVGLIGADELAAMSFTFPVIFVIHSIALGMGVGLSAVVAKSIGEKDQSKVQRFTTDGIMLSVFIVLTLMTIGLFTIESLFTMLGAKKDILPLIEGYMRIWYYGVPFVVIPMVGNSAIRATGDAFTPGMIMVISVIVNIVLDPILIFGFYSIPAMGLEGAALATVFARFLTMVAALWVLYFRDKLIILKIPSFKEIIFSWKKTIYVGLPAGLTNLIMPLSIGVITRLLSSYGNEVVAGFGVASRIEMLSFTIVIALSSVLGPFIGQNFGANKFDRVLKGINYSSYFAAATGLAVFILFIFSIEPIAELFSEDNRIIEIVVLYISIVSISYGAQGVVLLTGSSFNALHLPFHSVGLSVFKMFILYIPLAYIGSSFFGVEGIFSAALIANLLAGVTAFIWLKKVVHVKQGI